jgi:parvulin-like peptidyl-prolyl isomerase
MKKSFWLLCGILMIASLTMAQVKSQPSKKFVKSDQEPLMNAATNGQTIAIVGKGTELTVLEETATMAKVQITAWIPKANLSLSRPLRALHIAVKTRAEAESILAELSAGKDFVELAKTKSILPNAAKGGDLGYFNKGDFDPKIETAIEALNLNQISPIVETSFGFNIFKRVQ